MSTLLISKYFKPEFFAVKESLAFMYEKMQLFVEALRLYDELEAFAGSVDDNIDDDFCAAVLTRTGRQDSDSTETEGGDGDDGDDDRCREHGDGGRGLPEHRPGNAGRRWR